MGSFQKIALFYILALVIFFYGYAVSRFQVPPHAFLETLVQDIEAFIEGDVADKDISLVEKIQNDVGLFPKRFTHKYPEGIDDQHIPLTVPGLNSRREQPQIFTADQHRDGYRLIAGAMDYEEGLWGALLIGPDGKTVHTWHLSTEHLPGNKRPDVRKVLYGLHIGNDASIIFSMQESGGGLVKVDACSNEVWNVPGKFHHTVSGGDNGVVWTFIGEQGTIDQDMAKLSVDTGDILQVVDMTQVRKKNPDVHIWHLVDPRTAMKQGMAAKNHMTHGNDIDALTEEFAASFEQFEVGDLLVSYASTNLVFVLDPDTLLVKWWRIGITDYQHDPDWESDGRIGIFNNQWRRGMHRERFSEIVTIDPKNYESEIVYSGEESGFQTNCCGIHQRTDTNTRMITSSQQGWAFEVDDAGKTVFSFINSYDKEANKSLFLSKALRLPVEYFEGKPWEDC